MPRSPFTCLSPSFSLSPSLSAPTFPPASVMVPFASWFLPAQLSLLLSELPFGANPSCYFNCRLHAEAFHISTLGLSSRPPLLAVSGHGYLTVPSLPQTELSLLKARVPVCHQAHRGTQAGLSPLSPTSSHDHLQTFSCFSCCPQESSPLLLTKCTPEKHPNSLSLPPSKVSYTLCHHINHLTASIWPKIFHGSLLFSD